MDLPVTGPTVDFRALGAPLLRTAEAELQSVLTRPKLLGLLSFLACSPPGFHRRDTLLGLFWAEMDGERARRALRQSLYYLRQSLGPEVLVARGEDELGLDEGRLWCDVRAFERALEEGREEEALELYRGDLLTGFFVSGAPEFERWLDERRQELRRKVSDAAWSLARAEEASGNAAGAGHWARRATALEPFDERLLTQAVELLDRMGDRAGALRLYEAFRRRLEDELEIEPAPETQTLVAGIRGRVETRAVSSDAGSAPSGGAEPGEAPSVAGADETEEGTAENGVAGAGLEAVSRGTLPALGPRRSRWGRLAVGVVLAVVVVAALYQALGPGFGGPDLDPERVIVAVFENQTGDPQLDPIGRMAADWITQALHESGVVDVVPSTIGLAPRPDFTSGQSADATALAEESGAGTVVTGAYYQRGDSIEIQAQVIDIRTGDLLSALPPAGGPRGAPGPAVDSLSRSAVRTLAVLSEPSLAMSADRNRPPTLEAYRHYLEGLRLFERVPLQMREALPYFYRALELDPAFLAPRFYLIMTHSNLNEYALADSNAQALARERPRLSEEQQHTLDWFIARLNGDQMGALEATRARGGFDIGVQALAVNRPGEAVDVLSGSAEPLSYFYWLALMEAHHMLGDYERELDEAREGRDAFPGRMRMLDAELRALAALGRVAEVEQILDEAFTLPEEDPYTPGMVMATTAAELLTHGHQQLASAVADRAVAWWQSRPDDEANSRQNRAGLAFAYYQAERWADAERLFRELAAETPEDLDFAGFLGTLAARRDDAPEALAISDGLEGHAPRPMFGGDAYRQARIAAQLGELEGAVALLREAVARGFAYSVWLHRDIDLEPLHGYPAFEEILRPKG